MFCPKHPRYQAIFKPRVKRTYCWCWLLYVMKRRFGVKVGRPVVHRPKPEPDVLPGESPEAYTDRTGIKLGMQP